MDTISAIRIIVLCISMDQRDSTLPPRNASYGECRRALLRWEESSDEIAEACNGMRERGLDPVEIYKTCLRVAA